jgi:hypothetical protein
VREKIALKHQGVCLGQFGFVCLRLREGWSRAGSSSAWIGRGAASPINLSVDLYPHTRGSGIDVTVSGTKNDDSQVDGVEYEPLVTMTRKTNVHQ